MEGSIIVGNSRSNVINFDVVQCGVAKDKNKVNFFAKAAKKSKEKDSNTPAPIKVFDNKVMVKDGVISRFVVNKEKKAKTLSKSREKGLVARVMKRIEEKYGPTKESTQR